MIQLHNEIAEVNKKYNLERGDDISETHAKHRTTEQYHAALRIKLAKEVEGFDRGIEDKKPDLLEFL